MTYIKDITALIIVCANFYATAAVSQCVCAGVWRKANCWKWTNLWLLERRQQSSLVLARLLVSKLLRLLSFSPPLPPLLLSSSHVAIDQVCSPSNLLLLSSSPSPSPSYSPSLPPQPPCRIKLTRTRRERGPNPPLTSTS